MIRVALAFALLFPAAALAAQSGQGHVPGMHHSPPMGAAQATEPGQSAFAAIQEIVAILEADPATDWSKVDIEALRQHLIDMSNVTLGAAVESEPIDGGMRFTVTGTGPIRQSIQRMVAAHAETMNGVDGWAFKAGERLDGAVLTVTAPDPKAAAKLRGLGFIGIMTRGMHHQEHHLMIATGNGPHH